MPSGANRTQRRRAFTLVELLVVVVILGLLALVGAFAYNQVTESARKHAARMMAVHFAHDTAGVAAGKQALVGALRESSDLALTDVQADTDGSQVAVEYGTVNATTKDVVAGVSYKGYCTPVLFTGSPSKGIVGTTVKTTSSCKTDDGVPPTGDPILNPTGATGGSGGGGGSTGPAVVTLHGAVRNSLNLPAGAQVGDLIVFGSTWTGGLPTTCTDSRLTQVHPEATGPGTEGGMWVGIATTLDPLACTTPSGYNALTVYAGGLVPDGSSWTNTPTQPFNPTTVTAKAAVAFVATKGSTVPGAISVAAPWTGAMTSPGGTSNANVELAYWSDPTATSTPNLGAGQSGGFDNGMAIVVGLKAGTASTSSFTGIGYPALALRASNRGTLALPTGTQIGDLIVFGVNYTWVTGTTCSDPRLTHIEPSASGPNAQGGMWVGTATTLDPLQCTTLPANGVYAIAAFYNNGPVGTSSWTYSSGVQPFTPAALAGSAGIAVVVTKGSYVPGYAKVGPPWTIAARGEPSTSNFCLVIVYWRNQELASTPPLGAGQSGGFDYGLAIQATVSH